MLCSPLTNCHDCVRYYNHVTTFFLKDFRVPKLCYREDEQRGGYRSHHFIYNIELKVLAGKRAYGR